MRTRQERFRAAVDAERRAADACRAIEMADESASADARAALHQAVAELQEIDREDRA